MVTDTYIAYEIKATEEITSDIYKTENPAENPVEAHHLRE